MQSEEIRSRFLTFFEKRGHKIIPSAPLVPENDPSVLFNTAGMQPLVPFLLGKEHPLGKRLVNSQKCVRTQDIDEVGDNTHDTFFEMLGNWSLGDYFKEEAIKWSFELLTSKEEGFGLDPKRLYITVFEGNDDAPQDTEAYEIWKRILEKEGLDPEKRIYFMPAKSNWWSVGDNGPCGPDTEMFYDVTKEGLGDMTKEEYIKADDEQKVVEIWNDVFMQYEKKDGKVAGQLKNKNVDTGSGLERVVMAIQNKNNIFDTDLFQPIMNKIEEFTTAGDSLQRSKRIVADHIRTSVFIIGDGVIPSNTDQGYVLRRLLRRAVLHADKLQMKQGSLFWIAETVIEKYKDVYPELLSKKETIKSEIDKEEQKFRKALAGKGFAEISKRMIHGQLTGKDAFDIFQTYGIPKEVIIEEAQNFRQGLNETSSIAKTAFARDANSFLEEFEKLLKQHQELSRSGAEKKFKGGLGDTSDKSLQYHTTTHLLHQALRQVLGNHVQQKGSNITPERLRFDFTHPQKMTDEEKKKVEDIINEQIQKALPVNVVSLPFEEAEKTGALHFFGDKYGDVVTVYFIGDDLENAFSKEFCGGPHVHNTSDIKGTFKIAKEEAVSQGVRRIKAVVE